MSEKPETARPEKSMRPGAPDPSTDAMRSQTVRQPRGAPEESSRPADTTRAKIEDLGISETDVAAAIRWARSTEQSFSG